MLKKQFSTSDLKDPTKPHQPTGQLTQLHHKHATNMMSDIRLLPAYVNNRIDDPVHNTMVISCV